MISLAVVIGSLVRLFTNQANTRSDCILMKFPDSQSLYEKVRLNKLDHFQKMLLHSCKETYENEIKITNCTKSMFDIVLALIIDQKQLQEIFSKETLHNVYLYENIKEAIEYFHPESADNNTKQLLENLQQNPFHLSLHDAKLILDLYEKENLDLGSQESPPYLVGIAKTTVLKSKYFSSEGKAIEHFDNLCGFQVQKTQLEKLLKEKQFSCGNLQNIEIQEDFLYQIRDIESEIQILERKITSLKDEEMPDSISAKWNLSKYIYDQDPIIRDLARQVQNALLEAFKEKLKKKDFLAASCQPGKPGIIFSSNDCDLALALIPEHLRTYERCFQAVSCNPLNMAYVPAKFRAKIGEIAHGDLLERSQSSEYTEIRRHIPGTDVNFYEYKVSGDRAFAFPGQKPKRKRWSVADSNR